MKILIMVFILTLFTGCSSFVKTDVEKRDISSSPDVRFSQFQQRSEYFKFVTIRWNFDPTSEAFGSIIDNVISSVDGTYEVLTEKNIGSWIAFNGSSQEKQALEKFDIDGTFGFEMKMTSPNSVTLRLFLVNKPNDKINTSLVALPKEMLKEVIIKTIISKKLRFISMDSLVMGY